MEKEQKTIRPVAGLNRKQRRAMLRAETAKKLEDASVLAGQAIATQKNDIERRARLTAIGETMTVVMYTLRRSFGFGHDRMMRFIKESMLTTHIVELEGATYQEMLKAVEEETGIYYEIEMRRANDEARKEYSRRKTELSSLRYARVISKEDRV